MSVVDVRQAKQRMHEEVQATIARTYAPRPWYLRAWRTVKPWAAFALKVLVAAWVFGSAIAIVRLLWISAGKI